MAKQNKGGALGKLDARRGMPSTPVYEEIPHEELTVEPVAPVRPKKEKPPKPPRPKKTEKPSLLGKLGANSVGPQNSGLFEEADTAEAEVLAGQAATLPKRQDDVAQTSALAATTQTRETAGESPTPEAETTFDYQSFEEDVVRSEELTVARERRSEHMHAIMQKVITVLLIVGCVYLIFLSYGALNTKYVYKDGVVTPQQMSVSQIRDLKEFNVIATEYRQARKLYEKVLCLDYRVAEGIEDPLLIAPEYETLLSQINNLLIQCQATSVSPKYKQVHSMLQTWIGTDIAVYCQAMSKAISQNNATEAAKALEFRNLMYNDFSMITANITTVGETIDGADIADIQKWSPESFINDYIGDPGGALDG